MTRLRHLAISFCLVLNAGAAWQDGVWPSESYSWGTSVVHTLYWGIDTGNDHQEIHAVPYSYYRTPTNMSLQVRDLRPYDGFLAARERAMVLEHEAAETNLAYGNDLPVCTFFWYDTGYIGYSPQANLPAVKEWIVEDKPRSYRGRAGIWTTNFVCTTNEVGGKYDAYFDAHTNATLLPKWVVTNLLDYNSMPTNWCWWTPWKNLSGMGPGQGRLITNHWSFDSAVTVTVVDACSNTKVLTTSGPTNLAIVCTNEQIQAGFTTADYGWKRFTNLWDDLCWTEAYPSLANAGYRDAFAQGTDYNATVSALYSNWNATPWRNGFFGGKYQSMAERSLAGNIWSLRATRKKCTLFVETLTNWAHEVDVYFKFHEGFYTRADLDGYGYNTNVGFHFVETLSTASTTNRTYDIGISNTNNPYTLVSWGPLPTNNATERYGLSLKRYTAEPNVLLLMKWDFEYK